MLRRQIRERREYLFRKSEENKQEQIEEKKRILKAALESGKPIPTELRGEEEELRRLLKLDGERTDFRDDEYRRAGIDDPKILITTSRNPSTRLKQFAKEVKLIFPTSQRLNRGGTVLKELIQVCQENEVTDLVVLHETRGVPDGLIVSHLPYGPTAFFSLSNVVMRHDIEDVGKMSEANPHLIFENFSTKIGKRVSNILKYLFPVPREDSKRVMTFANDSDYISFRHHIFTKKGKEVELAEIGPRFEMRPYRVQMGTVDQSDADVEWVLKPYMNTAKKRTNL
eukprot:m.7932 g.7932  ORF g.7932 m.7932 type:complete len:283 (+) comp5948_c0_seq3:49-897(+)